MSFDWLDRFHQTRRKAPDYAEKTLAAYRLGVKAKGSIAGVAIQRGEGCCQLATALDGDTVYHPDEAPHLPLAGCPLGAACPCVYRPVMTYQLPASAAADDAPQPDTNMD